jgi:hypothetical protein
MMMSRTKHFIALAILFGGICIAQAPTPKDGYIPDEKTAVTVAEAVLSPIYGKEIPQLTFHAVLKDGIWHVAGTPIAYDGGSVQIRIDKETGKILGHVHYYK